MDSMADLLKAYNLTPEAEEVLQAAEMYANQYGGEIQTEHLLIVLAQADGTRAARILEQFGILSSDIEYDLALKEREVLESWLNGDTEFTMPIKGATPALIRVLDRASAELTESCSRQQRAPMDTEHLLLGLALEPNGLASAILFSNRLDHVAVRRELKRMDAGNEAAKVA